MTNPNEKEWWNKCPYRNERPGCRHCEITRNIVKEATRRGEERGERNGYLKGQKEARAHYYERVRSEGIQQGKREAWTEALKLEIPGRAFASDAGYRVACKHFTDWLEAKLVSLDNSSKE